MPEPHPEPSQHITSVKSSAGVFITGRAQNFEQDDADVRSLSCYEPHYAHQRGAWLLLHDGVWHEDGAHELYEHGVRLFHGYRLRGVGRLPDDAEQPVRDVRRLDDGDAYD